MELEQQMAHRVRGHLVTTLGGVGLALIGLAGSYAVAPALGTSGVALAATVCVGVIPAVSAWSAWRNLRCPACNGSVTLQVTASYTALGEQASKSCPHCGEPVFDRDLPRRSAALVVIAGALLLGIGLMISMVAGYQPLSP